MQRRRWFGPGRLAVVTVGMLASLLAAVGAAPARADHVASDVGVAIELFENPFTGGLVTALIDVGQFEGAPLDYTGAVTLTVPVPSGMTFWSVSGAFPLAAGGAPGGPTCAHPAQGGAGSVVCTGAMGADGSPTAEASFVVRTAQDGGSGLQAITDILITNGTISVAAFTPGTTGPVVVTATKANQSLPTSFSFKAVDVAGNVKTCA